LTCNTKKVLPGELFLLGGLILTSLANALLIKAKYGLTALSSLPYVVSLAFPLFSFGTWNAIFQCFWLLFTMAAIGKFKPGYLLSFVLAFVYGLVIDVWSIFILSWNDGVGLRLIYFMCGFLIMSLGISCFMICRLPILPFDTVVRAFTMEKNISVRKARTGFELLNLMLSLFISLLFLGGIVGIGMGTVLSALVMGTFVGKISARMNRQWDTKPKIAWLGKLV